MTKQQYVKQTGEEMRRIGTYREEFDTLIDIYGGMLEQYEIAAREHKRQGYAATVQTVSGSDEGVKSNPLVKQLESLRKDILAYSDRLCLNPKALSAADVKTPVHSALAEVLRELTAK